MATVVKHGDGFQTKIRRKGFKPISKTFPTHKLADEWGVRTEAEKFSGKYISRDEAESIRGHEVEMACDGVSGTACILRPQPDIALVDIGLPGTNGYDVARAIRAQVPQTQNQTHRPHRVRGADG